MGWLDEKASPGGKHQAGVGNSTTASEQRLIFSGQTLREGARLLELGVQKGAHIHLVTRLKADIELRVRAMSGKVAELSVSPTATPPRRCLNPSSSC